MQLQRRLLILLLLLLPGCRPEVQADPSVGVQPTPPPTGTLQVSFLNVGQGDAALVQTPGDVTVLIDGGDGEGDGVVETLRSAGVDRLDWIVGSHPHED